ncbi:MAG: Acg family FMN-binding oxidoreductase [Motilibacteraceae bacterium]
MTTGTRSALTRADVEAVVGDAVLAPSIHNTQPWRFHAHDDTVEVHADTGRTLRVVDPTGRALLLSVGAAVLNLRLSVLVRLGREPVVRLLPDADPAHVATVRVAGRRAPSPVDLALHAAVPRRRTRRDPFAATPLPREVVERLVTAAHVEGAGLRFLSGDAVRWVLDLTGEAERQWRADPAFQAELHRWTTEDPENVEGIPLPAAGPRDHLAHLHPRDFAAGRSWSGRPIARFEPHPQLAVLTTVTDRPADQLRAGQALQRVLLTATATDAGVCVGLLHQPLEVPDLRRLLRDPSSGPENPQMVLRLGYAPGPVPPAVHRRPLSEVLTVSDEP